MRDKIAAAMLKPISPSIVFILGLYTIVWGLWLINPWFSVFSTSVVYVAMASLMPEWVWGGVAILTGLCICKNPTTNSFGAFIGFMHWLIVGILYLVAQASSTFGITALTFAIYSGLLWLNIKCNKTTK